MAIGICLAAAALTISLPLQIFTLAWDHSIEKIRWEEDYAVVASPGGSRLLLTEARIRGSGAGMEVPPDAVLKDGVWHYTPTLGPLEQLNLARSGKVADYSVCWQGRCHSMADLVGTFAAAPLVHVSACPL
ncbi:MAG: hypothetical protein ACI83P_000162 [Janthinobacterium sp.]|jgi:hypothetical protein